LVFALRPNFTTKEGPVNKYKLQELGELYCVRWAIEEGYKVYKARVQVEAFSGKTATAVKQDIYAKAMMMTMCAAPAFPIEQRVSRSIRKDSGGERSSTHARSIKRMPIGQPKEF
jgi:DDE family transposase